ncbi:hypothetical protein BC332_25142 [Capsicum chinense]|nr:hypothetical protein BC332_25142 [Capsicum chinense]
MAKSYSKTEFHSLVEKVEAVDVRVKNYLNLAGYDKWVRSYASVHRGWTLTSNIAESINVALVIPASEYIYTVHGKEKHFIICLKEKKCSCNAFQLDEIPCVHACAVLDSKNFKKGPYCSDLYKPKTVLRTYDVPVYSLPHKNDWIIPNEILVEVVLLPKYK